MAAKSFGDASMSILLDGGDCLSGGKAQDSLKAEFLLEGMRALGYGPIALGDMDLMLGQAFLKRMAQKYGLKFLSANVYYADTNERFAKPYVIRRVGGRKILGIDVGGVRVGITSVLRLDDGTRISPKVAGDRELIVKDPTLSAREVVQELRGKSDVLICLAHTGMDPAKEIARGVGGFDMMLVGHGNFRNNGAIFVGKTALIQPGDQGRMIAVLDARLTDQMKVAGATGRLVALDDSYPDDERMTAILTRYKEAVHTANIAPEWENMDEQKYLGTAACEGCHPDEAEQWKATQHARAWQTLIDEKVDRDLECVPCHVTGFGTFNGFRRADLTPTMMDVQCEVCHGPGKDHFELISGGGDRSRLPLHGMKIINPKTCTACHRDDHDPTFDYPTDLMLVVHKPEEFKRELEKALRERAERMPPSEQEKPRSVE